MASLPRGSLATFMSTARSSLHSAIISQQRVSLILSDETGSLDSVISSILMAYVSSTAPSNTPLTNQSVNRHQPPNQYPPFHVPVVNQSHQDIMDRQDLATVLAQANLQKDHLITLDDLKVDPPAGLNPDNTSLLRPELTRLTLTCVSKLSGKLSPDFDACVIDHVDKHQRQRDGRAAVEGESGASTRVGSCASQAVNRCRESWDALSLGGSTSTIGSAQDDSLVGFDDAKVRQKWDAQVAKLALIAILLETDDLRKEEATTQLDRDACKYLETKIAVTDVSWDRKYFFQRITQAMNS